MGAVQGHSNKTVNPYDLHHALTFAEACCLAWIFHATSAENRQSIEQKGLLKDPRGGKGYSGRDSVHFMYQNDHSNGYIRMADGTTVPRTYRNPIYCVLVPRAAFEFQLFLSKNGVILIYDNIPPHLLKIVDQMPTMACPVMRAGRGHTLSPTVTRGVWPDDITYDRMKKEKGVGFVPGGDPGNMQKICNLQCEMHIFCIFWSLEKCISPHFLQKWRFAEICIFPGSKICKKYAFYSVKYILFAYFQGLKNAYFPGFLLKS